MPLLEIIQTRHVNASVRFTDTTAHLVDQYVAFLHLQGQPRATADEVIEQAVGYTFNKDREFQEFLRTPQAQSVTPTLRIRRGSSNDAAEPPAKKPAVGVQPAVQTSAVVTGLKA
jgi:hypothetical protein